MPHDVPSVTPEGGADGRNRLGHVATIWEAQAQADPLWAVLSEPDRLGRRWDLASFMETGVEQIEKGLRRFKELGGQLTDSEMALDFGCGVGRLTQPLAEHFEHVIGVDISPTMIAAADRLNRHPGRVEYRLNDQPDLAFLPDGSMSFVNSHITLQHLDPELATDYLREFFRVTKSGGGVIFQIPSHLTDDYLPSDRDDEPVAPDHRSGSATVIECPRIMTSGVPRTIRVRVTNKGGRPWVQSSLYPLHVGNHWIHRKERTHDDGRSRMPGRLGHGESCELELEVIPPAQPGLYKLVVDVVQEGVAWFADYGCTTGGRKVWVRANPPADAVAAGDQPDYPRDELQGVISSIWSEPALFEMHGIPRTSVEELIRTLGGRLLGTDEWITEWYGYTYYVQMA